MAWVTWITLAIMVSADAQASAVKEIVCSAIVESAQGKVDVIDDDTLTVLEHRSANGSFAYSRENLRAIRCLRTDLVPAVSDVKVLEAGYPLYIAEGVGGETRAGVLEVSSGQVRFRVVRGELTSEEEQRLLVRLNEIQEAGRSAH